jgi:two-component system NtrC family sensor kinase
MAASSLDDLVSLRRENERLAQDLSEARIERDRALQQQAAATEVLEVISSSPAEADLVFKAILQRAVALCAATFGIIYRFDGELIHIVAHHNFTKDALGTLE